MPSIRLQRLLVLFASLLLVSACQPEAPPVSASNNATPVAAYSVSTRDLSRPLRLSASVEPRTQIRLAARTAGTVQAVHHEEGERVQRGQLLAQLDVAEAAAELARTEAQLNSARLDYQRAVELRRRGVATELELQTAQVALQVAESHQALWSSRVAYGRIEAPQNAIITARHIDPGEAVDAQDTLFELADMDHLVLRLGVSELDVVHLAPGQQIPVHLDALPDLRLTGEVRRIFPAAMGTSRLITVELVLPPSSWDLGVKPGFLARIDTGIDPRPDTLVVPSAAIGSGDNGNYVYTITQEQLGYRPIQTGITRGRWTEIIDGLEPGETILASNPIDMQDAQPVRIVTYLE
ncbi:efflux RND transporter periplasmic adaptor subunit [Pseudomonas jilinensis]|nr:efflux RND transporter periplasmic adaptor subunit [Pseudomonas jilinensis]